MIGYNEFFTLQYIVVVLDRRGHGFPIGCAKMFTNMFLRGSAYSLGSCILTILYHHMYEIEYHGAQSMDCSVTFTNVVF